LIKGIIDRIEVEYAIVEIDGDIKTIRRSDIYVQYREGDVIVLVDNKWNVDRSETEKLAKEIKELADKLWE